MLYDYSDLMTGLNDQILPTFRTSLPQYVSDYYVNYSTTSDSGEPNLIQPIDLLYPDAAVPHSIAYYLTSTVRPMDAYVRTVGKAFEEADSNPVTTSPRNVPPSDQGDPDADHFITLSSEALLNQAIAKVDATDASIARFTRDTEAGKQAAQEWQDGSLSSEEILKEFRDNQNNVAWISGFLNTLSRQGLIVLTNLLYRSDLGSADANIAMLANAYAMAIGSGQLTPAAINTLIDTMFNGSGKGAADMEAFSKDFLQDLLKNPRAATSFVGSLTDEQLHQFLTGQELSSSDEGQELFFELLTITAKQMAAEGDPMALQGLVQRVGDQFSGITSNAPDQVMPYLTAFLQVAFAGLMTMPPSASSGQVEMDKWAKGQGAMCANLLKPYLQWINSSDTAINDRADAVWNIILTLGETAIGLIPVVGTAVSVAGSVALDALDDQYTSWMEDHAPFAKSENKINDAYIFQLSELKSSEWIFAANLIGSGEVATDTKPPVTVKLTDKNAVNNFLHNPQAYTVNGVEGDYVRQDFDSNFLKSYTANEDQVLGQG
jgi:hypothetical protein